MRAFLAAAVLALVAACSEPAPRTDSQPDPEAAEQVGEAGRLPRVLPPPGDQPRYVGLWATSAEGCDEPAWRFEPRRVTTRGEVSCEFNAVTETATGYDVDATCTAEAPPAPYRIQFGFAESARAMMISGGPWSATSLVYCGPTTTE